MSHSLRSRPFDRKLRTYHTSQELKTCYLPLTDNSPCYHISDLNHRHHKTSQCSPSGRHDKPLLPSVCRSGHALSGPAALRPLTAADTIALLGHSRQCPTSTSFSDRQINKQVRQQDAYLAIRPAYPRGVVLKGTKLICNQCFYTGNFWR